MVADKDLTEEKPKRSQIIIEPASPQMMSAWSKQLNSEGMNLYDKGDLQGVARLFKQSILDDVIHPLPL